MDAMTSGKDGALSVWSCGGGCVRYATAVNLGGQTWVMPVRRIQKSESSGLHVGFTKVRNSEMVYRIPLALSLHPSRQTGHS